MLNLFQKKEKITSNMINNIHYDKKTNWFNGKTSINSFN